MKYNIVYRIVDTAGKVLNIANYEGFESWFAGPGDLKKRVEDARNFLQDTECAKTTHEVEIVTMIPRKFDFSLDCPFCERRYCQCGDCHSSENGDTCENYTLPKWGCTQYRREDNFRDEDF